MSYLRMTTYCFSCDNPGGCSSRWGDGWCVTPPHGTGLREAEKDLRRSGWTLRDGKYFCLDHKPEDRS